MIDSGHRGNEMAYDVMSWGLINTWLGGGSFRSKQLVWPSMVFISVAYGYRTIIGHYVHCACQRSVTWDGRE